MYVGCVKMSAVFHCVCLCVGKFLTFYWLYYRWLFTEGFGEGWVVHVLMCCWWESWPFVFVTDKYSELWKMTEVCCGCSFLSSGPLHVNSQPLHRPRSDFIWLLVSILKCIIYGLLPQTELIKLNFSFHLMAAALSDLCSNEKFYTLTQYTQK